MDIICSLWCFLYRRYLFPISSLIVLYTLRHKCKYSFLLLKNGYHFDGVYESYKLFIFSLQRKCCKDSRCKGSHYRRVYIYNIYIIYI